MQKKKCNEKRKQNGEENRGEVKSTRMKQYVVSTQLLPEQKNGEKLKNKFHGKLS